MLLIINIQYKKNSYRDLTPFFGYNDGEKWFRKNYFEIQRWPSEIPANLQGQFSLSGQIFLHWVAATLKGLGEFQNKKNLDHFSPSFLPQKCLFQDSTRHIGRMSSH